MSTWLLIFVLAGVLFFNRYLLLEPKLPIRIPRLVQHALSYSAPCLLSAICGPIILQGKGLNALVHSAYFYATLLAIVTAWLVRNMLLAVLLSLGGFYLILYWFY